MHRWCGPLARSARTARRRRPPAKCERSANIPVIVRAVAPHARRTMGKCFPIQPGRRASRAARRLLSMVRQATEKEQVMSFEAMSESAKSAGLPTEFKFDESPVRVVMEEGEPWFVAKDICEILGLDNPSMAVSRLDDDERGVSNVDTTEGKREMLTVNEPGLYALIFRAGSPRPSASANGSQARSCRRFARPAATRAPAATSVSRAMRSITSAGSSSARCWTPRSLPSKCSASASIFFSR